MATKRVRVICKPDQTIDMDMIDAGSACVGTIADILDNMSASFKGTVTQEDVQVMSNASDPDVYISKSM